jgi:hypothetical protein
VARRATGEREGEGRACTAGGGDLDLDQPARRHGSAPDVVARALVHTLTSRRPRTRYPVGAGAKRLLFMRRVLPERVLDRMVMRTVGLRSA